MLSTQIHVFIIISSIIFNIKLLVSQKQKNAKSMKKRKQLLSFLENVSDVICV